MKQTTIQADENLFSSVRVKERNERNGRKETFKDENFHLLLMRGASTPVVDSVEEPGLGGPSIIFSYIPSELSESGVFCRGGIGYKFK